MLWAAFQLIFLSVAEGAIYNSFRRFYTYNYPHTNTSSSCSDYIDLWLEWYTENGTIELTIDGPSDQWFSVSFPDRSEYFTEADQSKNFWRDYSILVITNSGNLTVNDSEATILEINVDVNGSDFTMQSDSNQNLETMWIDVNETTMRTKVKVSRSVGNSLDSDDFSFLIDSGGDSYLDCYPLMVTGAIGKDLDIFSGNFSQTTFKTEYLYFYDIAVKNISNLTYSVSSVRYNFSGSASSDLWVAFSMSMASEDSGVSVEITQQSKKLWFSVLYPNIVSETYYSQSGNDVPSYMLGRGSALFGDDWDICISTGNCGSNVLVRDIDVISPSILPTVNPASAVNVDGWTSMIVELEEQSLPLTSDYTSVTADGNRYTMYTQDAITCAAQHPFYEYLTCRPLTIGLAGQQYEAFATYYGIWQAGVGYGRHGAFTKQFFEFPTRQPTRSPTDMPTSAPSSAPSMPPTPSPTAPQVKYYGERSWTVATERTFAVKMFVWQYADNRNGIIRWRLDFPAEYASAFVFSKSSKSVTSFNSFLTTFGDDYVLLLNGFSDTPVEETTVASNGNSSYPGLDAGSTPQNVTIESYGTYVNTHNVSTAKLVFTRAIDTSDINDLAFNVSWLMDPFYICYMTSIVKDMENIFYSASGDILTSGFFGCRSLSLDGNFMLETSIYEEDADISLSFLYDPFDTFCMNGTIIMPENAWYIIGGFYQDASVWPNATVLDSFVFDTAISEANQVTVSYQWTVTGGAFLLESLEPGTSEGFGFDQSINVNGYHEIDFHRCGYDLDSFSDLGWDSARWMFTGEMSYFSVFGFVPKVGGAVTKDIEDYLNVPYYNFTLRTDDSLRLVYITFNPTDAPSMAPSRVPSGSPSQPPTMVPSMAPSRVPSSAPSSAPSMSPTMAPTNALASQSMYFSMNSNENEPSDDNDGSTFLDAYIYSVEAILSRYGVDSQNVTWVDANITDYEGLTSSTGGSSTRRRMQSSDFGVEFSGDIERLNEDERWELLYYVNSNLDLLYVYMTDALIDSGYNVSIDGIKYLEAAHTITSLNPICDDLPYPRICYAQLYSDNNMSLHFSLALDNETQSLLYRLYYDGNEDVWFGVGFAESMAQGGEAAIYATFGTDEELRHYLLTGGQSYDAIEYGSNFESSYSMMEDGSVYANATRDFDSGASSEDVFTGDETYIDLIWAIGVESSGYALSTDGHQARGSKRKLFTPSPTQALSYFDSSETYEYEDPCAGVNSFGSTVTASSTYGIVIGFYIYCDTRTVEVYMEGPMDRWFGIVFGKNMTSGDGNTALVYTTGKENQLNAGVYQYFLTDRTKSGVNRVPSVNWTLVNSSDDGTTIKMTYSQYLYKTEWDVTTSSIDFRWAIGKSGNLTLSKHVAVGESVTVDVSGASADGDEDEALELVVILHGALMFCGWTVFIGAALVFGASGEKIFKKSEQSMKVHALFAIIGILCVLGGFGAIMGYESEESSSSSDENEWDEIHHLMGYILVGCAIVLLITGFIGRFFCIGQNSFWRKVWEVFHIWIGIGSWLASQFQMFTGLSKYVDTFDVLTIASWISGLIMISLFLGYKISQCQKDDRPTTQRLNSGQTGDKEVEMGFEADANSPNSPNSPPAGHTKTQSANSASSDDTVGNAVGDAVDTQTEPMIERNPTDGMDI